MFNAKAYPAASERLRTKTQPERSTKVTAPMIQITESNTDAAEDTAVSFPKGKRRSESPIFTHNELFIEAPAERIFAALVSATEWPRFYGNAKNVVIDGDDPKLTLGTLFHWTTFGVRVHTTIEEFVPNRRLAWSGRGLGSTAYHGWVIEPKEGGCLVITEETQQGFIPSVGRFFLRGGLLKWHQRWLEGLAKVTAARVA